MLLGLQRQQERRAGRKLDIARRNAAQIAPLSTSVMTRRGDSPTHSEFIFAAYAQESVVHGVAKHLLRMPVLLPEPIIRLPKHSFWFRWEHTGETRIAAKPLTNAVGALPGMLRKWVILRRIRHPAALSATIETASIEHFPPCVAAWANEPISHAAKVRFCQVQTDWVANVFPWLSA
jgi:hypothetical protein